jgi:hypothetical protein
MGLASCFDDSGKIYGFLYIVVHRGEEARKPIWGINLYSSEKGRRAGIKNLWKFHHYQQSPLLKFELTLSEINQRSLPIPFIPDDKAGLLENEIIPPKIIKLIRSPNE